MTRTFCATVGAALACACVLPAAASAAPVTYTAPGAFDVPTTVSNFRTALGTPHREITWDDVALGSLAPDYYNDDNPQGVVLTGAGALDVRQETGSFPAFSPSHWFVPLGSTVTDVSFFVPGTSRRATVAGFGAVVSDVDAAGATRIVAIGPFGEVLASVDAPVNNAGVSFAGVIVDPADRIARVRIVNGTLAFDSATADSASTDKVAVDNLVYGEPGQPVVSISDAGTITEGDDGSQTATFTVTRTVDTKSVLTVPYATLGDGAAEGGDYTGKAGTIAFNSGVLSRTIEVSVLGDKVDEADEAFRVVLLDDGQATLADGDGRAVIADNDPTVVSPLVTPAPTPTPTPTGGYDPAKDQTPPKLAVTGYPKGKKCARRDFTLRVSAVEDGLASLRVRLDKTVLSDRASAAATTERLRLRVPAKGLKKGKHTLRVNARDRGGNTASRTIRFRRC